jgi:transcriptional regulator with XRE-family HTH domain
MWTEHYNKAGDIDVDASRNKRWSSEIVPDNDVACPGSVVETLANRLRNARQRRGWTQQELAIKAHTSQSVIQKIENGKSTRPRNIEIVAKTLEVDPSWLLFGVGETAQLSPEAIAVAKTWSELSEPERSSVRESVMHLLKRVDRVNGSAKHS